MCKIGNRSGRFQAAHGGRIIIIAETEGWLGVIGGISEADMHELAGLKILIIEDMEELLTFHRRWLGLEKVESRGCTTGAEGIRLFDSLPELDLVILDMILPDIHGLEVLRHIRAANQEIPVIVCSGYNENMVELLKYLNVRFIAKPFTLPALRSMVADMTGRTGND